MLLVHDCMTQRGVPCERVEETVDFDDTNDDSVGGKYGKGKMTMYRCLHCGSVRYLRFEGHDHILDIQDKDGNIKLQRRKK